MPGRSPAEAFNAFIDPLAEAVSCLGAAKIVPSPGGRAVPNVVHAWALNGETGMAFPGGWHFEAQMHYEIVQRPVSREWRVKTHGYRYRLALRGTHLWRLHWHPTVTSGYHLPHLHMNLGRPGDVPLETMSQHHPTGRMTFEDAVEWIFRVGIEPARENWNEIISASRERHLEHRSWDRYPPGSPV